MMIGKYFIGVGLSITLLLGSSAQAATRHGNVVPPAVREIAEMHQVPATILYAVAMNETKTKLASDNVKPWPWSINVAGRSYQYANKVQACSAYHNFAKTYSTKNIDIGIAQVNVGYNGKKYFRSVCDGFDPFMNLHVAASIIKACYAMRNSWVRAAGCYHRPAGGAPAEKYMANIRRNLKLIKGIDLQPSGADALIRSAYHKLKHQPELNTPLPLPETENIPEVAAVTPRSTVNSSVERVVNKLTTSGIATQQATELVGNPQSEHNEIILSALSPEEVIVPGIKSFDEGVQSITERSSEPSGDESHLTASRANKPEMALTASDFDEPEKSAVEFSNVSQSIATENHEMQKSAQGEVKNTRAQQQAERQKLLAERKAARKKQREVARAAANNHKLPTQRLQVAQMQKVQTTPVTWINPTDSDVTWIQPN